MICPIKEKSVLVIRVYREVVCPTVVIIITILLKCHIVGRIILIMYYQGRAECKRGRHIKHETTILYRCKIFVKTEVSKFVRI